MNNLMSVVKRKTIWYEKGHIYVLLINILKERFTSINFKISFPFFYLFPLITWRCLTRSLVLPSISIHASVEVSCRCGYLLRKDMPCMHLHGYTIIMGWCVSLRNHVDHACRYLHWCISCSRDCHWNRSRSYVVRE
jgi:hypothetical protein